MQALQTAMVLAAGMGNRMRPLTDAVPKPMIKLGGRPLIDHVLDRLGEAGIRYAVVNVHHLPEIIEGHLATRTMPEVIISDERGRLLDTGGAVKKALPLLGDGPFFVHNSDSVWIEDHARNLERMSAAWDGARMDWLLMLAPVADSIGYGGRGDFALADDGRLRRRAPGGTVPYVFAGVSITHGRLFADCPDGAFSLNSLWDEALARGRLFGLRHEGVWMHVGAPDALAAAERRLNGGRG